MYVGSKERLLDLENTWLIYRGFITHPSLMAFVRYAHGTFLEGACSSSDTISTRTSVSAHSLLDNSDLPPLRGGDEL